MYRFLADERIDWIFFASAAYFFNDTVFSIIFKIAPLTHTLPHHILAMAGLILSVAARRYMWFAFFLLMCSELTMPFNNMSWFVQKSGSRNVIALFGWTVMFFIFRVANNVIVIQRVVEHWKDLMEQHLLLRTIIIGNLFFLLSVHTLMATVTLFFPTHSIALPMPSWWPTLKGKVQEHIYAHATTATRHTTAKLMAKKDK
jgi:hypothetical protein